VGSSGSSRAAAKERFDNMIGMIAPEDLEAIEHREFLEIG
jgi:hypothetical protein